jgi:hypothetical protein
MYSSAARCKRVASTRPRLTTTAHHSYHTTPYDAYHIRICLPLPHPNGYFMRSLDSGCILASGLRNKARRSVGTIVAHSVETAGRRLRGAQIIARHKQRTPSHGHLEDPEAEENGRLHAPDCTAPWHFDRRHLNSRHLIEHKSSRAHGVHGQHYGCGWISRRYQNECWATREKHHAALAVVHDG